MGGRGASCFLRRDAAGTRRRGRLRYHSGLILPTPPNGEQRHPPPRPGLEGIPAPLTESPRPATKERAFAGRLGEQAGHSVAAALPHSAIRVSKGGFLYSPDLPAKHTCGAKGSAAQMNRRDAMNAEKNGIRRVFPNRFRADSDSAFHLKSESALNLWGIPGSACRNPRFQGAPHGAIPGWNFSENFSCYGFLYVLFIK